MKYANTPPRKNAVWTVELEFHCPNCNRKHHRTLWAEAEEIDTETGKPTTYDFVHADALCPCGAQILVADDCESLKMFWLNEKQMKERGV